jgi:septum site-determining protein MinC
MNMAGESNKNPVRLKGIGNHLCISYDPRDSLEYVTAEIKKLFSGLQTSSLQKRIVLDTGTRKGYDEKIEKLQTYLKKTYGFESVTRSSKKKMESAKEETQKTQGTDWQNSTSEALMLSGRVRSGQKVTARRHVMILGDVNPGGEIVAGGDIIVLGSLRGTAAAGQPDNNDAIVLALDFRPTQVQIAGFVAAGLPPSQRKITEFAHVEDETIVVDDYMQTAPFGKMPWPRVR